jgi:hypothetical protein
MATVVAMKANTNLSRISGAISMGTALSPSAGHVQRDMALRASMTRKIMPIPKPKARVAICSVTVG